jgi:hypothetical protein
LHQRATPKPESMLPFSSDLLESRHCHIRPLIIACQSALEH